MNRKEIKKTYHSPGWVHRRTAYVNRGWTAAHSQHASWTCRVTSLFRSAAAAAARPLTGSFCQQTVKVLVRGCPYRRCILHQDCLQSLSACIQLFSQLFLAVFQVCFWWTFLGYTKYTKSGMKFINMTTHWNLNEKTVIYVNLKDGFLDIILYHKKEKIF